MIALASFIGTSIELFAEADGNNLPHRIVEPCRPILPLSKYNGMPLKLLFAPMTPKEDISTAVFNHYMPLVQFPAPAPLSMGSFCKAARFGICTAPAQTTVPCKTCGEMYHPVCLGDNFMQRGQLCGCLRVHPLSFTW